MKLDVRNRKTGGTERMTSAKAPKAARAPAKRRAAARPGLTLRASARRVAAGGTIEVGVDFSRLATVDLVVEPRGAFALDLRALTRPGVVRLKGRKHGKATLIATGRPAAAGAPETRRLLHVECEGPKVGLSDFEYLPADA